MRLDPTIAARLFAMIEPGLRRPYPYKSGLVLHSERDLQPPKARTPIFYGCFDWHSAVHSHWSLARLRRTFPNAPWADRATNLLEEHFTSDKANAELSVLQAHSGFELPYGIAWLLQLCAELSLGDAAAQRWRGLLQPLEDLAATRFANWLTNLPCPTRDGQHSQSAFSMSFALQAAMVLDHSELAETIRTCAMSFYENDANAPVSYEPSAYDFLSPCLAEAELMSRVLEPHHFHTWLARFLPAFELAPVRATDRNNGKLAHFDGLNFSRAWMLERIADIVGDSDPRCQKLRDLAARHGNAGMQSLDSLTYMGTHWVGSFALYWCTQG